MTAATLTLTPWADLSDALPGCSAVTLSIALDGSIYAVGRRSTEPARDPSGMFAKSRLDVPSDVVTARWRDGVVTTIVVRDQVVPVYFAQPLSEGTLLVGARCAWRSAGAEKNALVVDDAGAVLRRMTLGDGIADVRTTSDDRIWVSYFDEGVFGNYGWSQPGPEAIGASGLLAFDARGQTVYRFDAGAAGTDMICDAYALNVAGDDDVWVCFYTDFPLVRFHAGRYDVWPSFAGGPSAIAVDGDRALLVGSYQHRARGHVVDLGARGAATPGADRELVDEHGASLTHARFVGVGAMLYAVTNGVVRAVSDW